MVLLRQDGTLERRAVLPALILAKPRPDLVRKLKVAEREHIESALILCEGNRVLAAKRLGIAYRTLMRKIEMYRIEDGDA